MIKICFWYFTTVGKTADRKRPINNRVFKILKKRKIYNSNQRTKRREGSKFSIVIIIMWLRGKRDCSKLSIRLKVKVKKSSQSKKIQTETKSCPATKKSWQQTKSGNFKLKNQNKSITKTVKRSIIASKFCHRKAHKIIKK